MKLKVLYGDDVLFDLEMFAYKRVDPYNKFVKFKRLDGSAVIVGQQALSDVGIGYALFCSGAYRNSVLKGAQPRNRRASEVFPVGEGTFDQRMLNRLRGHSDPEETRRELEQTMRDYVDLRADSAPPAGIANMYVACAAGTSLGRPQCAPGADPAAAKRLAS